MTRGLLTIAYGAPSYVRMAKGLARSLRFHNPAVSLAVVTDSGDRELKCPLAGGLGEECKLPPKLNACHWVFSPTA